MTCDAGGGLVARGPGEGTPHVFSDRLSVSAGTMLVGSQGMDRLPRYL